MSYALPAETIAAFETAAREIRAGAVQRRGKAAFGDSPLDIVSVWPADAMPSWLEYVLSGLGERLDRDDWAHFYERLAWAGARWSVLSDTAWERLGREFAAQALEHLFAIAAPLQPDPPPRYWREIAPLAQAVIRALRGDGDLKPATDELECWSIPEGYDLWDQENATIEAELAAHCLARAAYGLDPDNGHSMGGLVQEAVVADRRLGTPHFLLRTLLQGLAGEIGMANWT